MSLTYIEKLQRVYIEARGMCGGQDWNKGSAARHHRKSLVEAVNDIYPLPNMDAARVSTAAKEEKSVEDEEVVMDSLFQCRLSFVEEVLVIPRNMFAVSNDYETEGRHKEAACLRACARFVQKVIDSMDVKRDETDDVIDVAAKELCSMRGFDPEKEENLSKARKMVHDWLDCGEALDRADRILS